MDKANIDAATREILDAMCMVSQIANWMYPEIPLAKDRERRFYAEGGEFAKAIYMAAWRHESIYRRMIGEDAIPSVPLAVDGIMGQVIING